ncbi:isocitrate lyase/phosphoenolpyruvate mutase family protein [Pseudenterobacter timonensis]|uniref:Isocitrate lyase/phosphoenolpyruvate mutase family protein n=1 Tax=Pseudenterobacter timonensis TaxID=1755099 RepID=A0AAE4DQ16_9ENTR|nr:isocitrate lyase/phosphoenolpyruvate mutase family protein [Pseudenterobacter timonensis]MDR9891930.1 isocitrate lyase/phosphoenolpyruvate mutase family protein [Pseudenterobacter timonensis]
MDFTSLHHASSPLLVANVWDASSALAARQAGYRALGTSSAAIAAMLGYEDGEQIALDELLFIVSRIRTVTDLPLSVDLEAGYGDTLFAIQRLARIGVVGINLEDSHVVNGVRQLDDANSFADKLETIAQARTGLFLNIRTDSFLVSCENALEEALRRGRLYAGRGADGLFVPGVTQNEDIATLAREIPLPLNVMCMPGLADFATLQALGVRRISMGNFVHGALQTALNALLSSLQQQQTFAGLFSHESHR